MTNLRGYQQRAVELGKKQSLIVVLPTGSGKTLIAATIAAHHAGKGSAVLFLVPTCLLVQQQARAIRDETGLDVVEYMGGTEAPPFSRRFHVLVSTPAAFISINALSSSSSSSDGRFRYEAFGCVVFDEIHHVMKKHPYRSIARGLACMRSPPLILGLTASLTYAMQTSRIQTAILELCSELNISGDCIFSASQEELIVDGYHASATSSVMLTSDLDLIGSTAGMDGLEIPGKPHAVMSDFMRCYEARSLHALSLEVVDSVRSVERHVVRLDARFVTPIGAAGKRGKSGEWSFYANERKTTCTGRELQQLYHVLEHLYEAMRLLINSRQTALELAMTYLEMNDVLHVPALSSLNKNWRSCKDNFCRIAHLKEVLSQQSERFPDGLRCIVFVQQRITTHILHHALSSDEDFASVLVSDYIYATSSPATCTLSVSPARSRETIELFRSGQVQVLFATSVAEEGTACIFIIYHLHYASSSLARIEVRDNFSTNCCFSRHGYPCCQLRDSLRCSDHSSVPRTEPRTSSSSRQLIRHPQRG